MELWVEAYPAAPTYFSILVNSNDTIFSDVYNNNNGTWTLLIENYTSGAYAIGTVGCCPDTRTAEWITEAQPGTPIPFFNSVYFQTALFYVNGSSAQPIDSTLAQTTWNIKLVRGSSCIHADVIFADHQSFQTGLGC